MALTLSIRTLVTTPAGFRSDYTQNIVSGDGDVVADVVVPASTTQLVALSYLTAGIRGYLISSDKNLTLKVDDATTPLDTLTVVAGVPLLYPSAAKLLLHDTAVGIYAVNGVGAVANLHIEIVCDITP